MLDSVGSKDRTQPLVSIGVKTRKYTFKLKASERPPGVSTGIFQTPAYRAIGANTYLQTNPMKASMK